MRVKLPKKDDVILIGAFGGSRVVAHYLGGPPEQVPLAVFYRCPEGWSVEDGIGRCELLFGPVMVGVNPPVRSGRWSILGRAESGPFTFPLFLQGGPIKGVPNGKWWLFDGNKDRLLGEKVPPKYQHLEVGVGWSAELIEDRIETGQNPFGYEAMMKWNDSGEPSE